MAAAAFLPASTGQVDPRWLVCERSDDGAHRPRLLDRVRAALRTRHYSVRTEKAYVGWVRRYFLFHDKRHPAEMGAGEVTRFLTSLARRSSWPGYSTAPACDCSNARGSG